MGYRGWSELRRREFLKMCGAAIAGTVAPFGALLGPVRGFAAPSEAGKKPQAGDGVQSVQPEIGTGWRGHMFPGAVAPFGLVQLSPDTAGAPEIQWNKRGDYTGWDHCSGYYYPDNVLIGFSHTHVQGTGGGDLGDILLMPVVEGKNWSFDPGIPQDLAEEQIEALGPDSGWVFDKSVPGYRSFFTHERETAHAGYYSVHLLTPDVEAELTATTRCGMHRYSYPALPGATRRGAILDLVHGIGCKVYHAELKIESATRVSGMRATHGWAEDKQAYFVMEFSRPLTSMDVSVDGAVSTASAGSEFKGKEIKAIFGDAASGEPLVIRVGISCTSVEGAAKNLAAEIAHWDFDAAARDAEQEWSKALGLIEASMPTNELTETFYTGAYRGLVAPATFNDVDGAYRGQDRQNHLHPGFTKYTTLSIWDIYRGEFPFIMLMQPHRASDIVRTLVADYEQLGLYTLPMWPLWGNETWSMTGFHAAGMIVGAYTRGLRDFDAEAAYAAIRDTALCVRDSAPPGASARDIGRSRDNGKLQENFRRFGYVPMDLHGGSVSCTLDLAYDYWCAGAMAELLGKQDDAALFYKLGQNYKNVYDASTGFMRPKTKDGKWRDPFEPDIQYEDYVETDAWQASFSVPHDVQGLIDLHGGDDAFVAKLDALFTAPSYVSGPPWPQPDISGMVGQDAQGNEPSNHNPYLYPFAGAAWKTQYWARKVAGLYNNSPAGIPGNDDCGQLASWFVFAALGFYPVNASTGVYVIGSPIVSRAAIRNPQSGATFTIIAENNSPDNVYIQSAELNGREWNRSWLTHAQIVAGGELRFRMASGPNKEWAAAKADRPPSGLVRS
jgi:predicted alpha-1,2-mannosidase